MFKQYARRAKLSDLRDFVPGENMAGISVSDEDSPGSDPDDKVARNPENHRDQWFIAGAYFRANFEPQPID